MQRRIPLFTGEGVRDAEVTVHPFAAGDGLGLTLTRYRRTSAATPAPGDAVLLVHGLTTSSDMFVMPEHEDLTSYLLDHGHPDVWALDSRMSNRFPYDMASHRFTLDDVALHDFPAAFAEIRAHIGPAARLHVIAHCLGGVTFAMSLAAGLVGGVTSAVVNSSALVLRVPRWSRCKLYAVPGLTEYVLGLPYLNPAWPQDAPFTRGRMIARLVSLFHPECRAGSCHMVSAMWGSGRPALYEHAHLSPVTHERVADLFGATGVHYYRHIRAMVRAGRAVKYRPGDPAYRDLPDDYLEAAAGLTTPLLLTTGDRNHVMADSNPACYRELSARAPGISRLRIFPGYGHQDVFMGKDSARDVFPHLTAFLDAHAG
ncbi:alpha/beta hydrolase [Streptomyces sp. NRRL F-5755]|uniref:alpha/beta hydrolase n=1 Tax=Streptomyces sp. NRRL F-5755 TaxID=1519475 RepID=UPI0006AFA477|nr:alpha/beta fold hydrolase [Streptomyces sp. NRRL F-5755]KOT88611.1 alpha/beta hydrolase [Streptomyces sp. NRRL F-5755]